MGRKPCVVACSTHHEKTWCWRTAHAAHARRPVHIAAQNGFLPILKHLVSMGCSVNAQNTRGNTGMHM